MRKTLESIAEEVYISRVSRTLLARPAKPPSKTYREDEDGYEEDDPHHEEGSKPESRGADRGITEERRNCPKDHHTISKESRTGPKGSSGSASSKESGASAQARRNRH